MPADLRVLAWHLKLILISRLYRCKFMDKSQHFLKHGYNYSVFSTQIFKFFQNQWLPFLRSQNSSNLYYQYISDLRNYCIMFSQLGFYFSSFFPKKISLNQCFKMITPESHYNLINSLGMHYACQYIKSLIQIVYPFQISVI